MPLVFQNASAVRTNDLGGVEWKNIIELARGVLLCIENSQVGVIQLKRLTRATDGKRKAKLTLPGNSR